MGVAKKMGATPNKPLERPAARIRPPPLSGGVRHTEPKLREYIFDPTSGLPEIEVVVRAGA